MDEMKIFGVLLAVIFTMPFFIAVGVYHDMSALQITAALAVGSSGLIGIVVLRTLVQICRA